MMSFLFWAFVAGGGGSFKRVELSENQMKTRPDHACRVMV